MPAHWTTRRAARLGYLAGRGFSPASIMADDEIAARSERAVRTAASRLGISIRSGDDLLALPSLDVPTRRALAAEAARRGISAAQLLALIVGIVVADDLFAALDIETGYHPERLTTRSMGR